jgi:two-component system sensor histidine kinase UhpB
MKSSAPYICLFAILLIYFEGDAQSIYIDSIKKTLSTQRTDTNRVKLLNKISMFYLGYNADSSLIYAQQALDLAGKLNYEPGIYNAEEYLCSSLTTLGNYPLALDFGLKGLATSKKIGDPYFIGLANVRLVTCYYYLGDYNTSLEYVRELEKIVKESHPDSLAFVCCNMSMLFDAMHQPDSAMLYAKKCYKGLKGWHYLGYYNEIYTLMGNAYASKGSNDSALFYYKTGIPIAIEHYSETDLIENYNGIAKVFMATGNLDSAVWYAKKVLAEKLGKTYPLGILKATNLLAGVYELQNKPDSSLKYLKKAIVLKDSLFNREKTIAIQNINYKEHEKQKEIEAARIKSRNQFIMYFSLAGLLALLVITGISLRNNRLKQLQNMRNSIADDLHDDIGSTLSSIGIMSELAKAKSPEALTLLASIEESTNTIQENMSDIVWAVNPKNDRFENVLQRMNQFASEILEAKNIELDFTSDASLSALRITMGQRKNFYLFFKEAINNAAKYSDAKKVSVWITQKDHQVEMNISDNGKGFDTSKIFNGNGMSTLRKRGAELCADFKIQSLIKEGTVVKLKFKIT